MPEICRRNTFRISFRFLTWDSNPGFSSNKPTHYLLDHGDFTIYLRFLYFDFPSGSFSVVGTSVITCGKQGMTQSTSLNHYEGRKMHDISLGVYLTLCSLFNSILICYQSQESIDFPLFDPFTNSYSF